MRCSRCRGRHFCWPGDDKCARCLQELRHEQGVKSRGLRFSEMPCRNQQDRDKGGVANGHEECDPRNKSSHALNHTANVWFSPAELEGKFPVSAFPRVSNQKHQNRIPSAIITLLMPLAPGTQLGRYEINSTTRRRRNGRSVPCAGHSPGSHGSDQDPAARDVARSASQTALRTRSQDHLQSESSEHLRIARRRFAR